jgi:hypothetical protein
VLVQVVNPAPARARGSQSSRGPNACYGAVDAPQQFWASIRALILPGKTAMTRRG